MDLNAELISVIVGIPNNTVKLTLIADIIDEDNNIQQAESKLSLPEIIDARILGDEWETENVRYYINENYFKKE